MFRCHQLEFEQAGAHPRIGVYGKRHALDRDVFGVDVEVGHEIHAQIQFSHRKRGQEVDVVEVVSRELHDRARRRRVGRYHLKDFVEDDIEDGDAVKRRQHVQVQQADLVAGEIEGVDVGRACEPAHLQTPQTIVVDFQNLQVAHVGKRVVFYESYVVHRQVYVLHLRVLKHQVSDDLNAVTLQRDFGDFRKLGEYHGMDFLQTDIVGVDRHQIRHRRYRSSTKTMHFRNNRNCVPHFSTPAHVDVAIDAYSFRTHYGECVVM